MTDDVKNEIIKDFLNLPFKIINHYSELSSDNYDVDKSVLFSICFCFSDEMKYILENYDMNEKCFKD